TQPPRRLPQVERLDTEPVACNECPARRSLDDDEREHAVEALDAALAPLRIGLEDHLRIARRTESMAEVLELSPKRLEVVDAAVENDHEAELVVDHRLGRALGQVEDLQAPVAQRHVPLGEQAFTVRPARSLALDHALDRPRIG